MNDQQDDDEVEVDEAADDDEFGDGWDDDDDWEDDEDDGSSLLDAFGSGGGLDMGALLGQALQMRDQLLAAQADAANAEVEGQAGGGVVRVRVTGGMEFRSVLIDPTVVDADDVELLQDLVLAALHDAVAQVGALSHQAMGGLDLGNLGGLLGGPPS